MSLGPRQPLSRETAWACVTANLAVPGAGSLMAGRLSGYVQAALMAGGLVLTVLFGARLGVWYFHNWSRLQTETDPLAALSELWQQIRWPLLGFALFALAWIWALVSSWQILSEAKKSQNLPPPEASS
ncbi:MAG TPA: hypothetical protein VG146_03640 [Verrucomicrobiae bacterium]|nr:hypothetical protein [Verrucomicrobiae bacterium]